MARRRSQKRIALERIATLFKLARAVAHRDYELAQRYVNLARALGMRYKVRLPVEYRRMVCRHCKGLILPGVNCRVRLQQKREPHKVVTCLNCGRQTRLLLRSKR